MSRKSIRHVVTEGPDDLAALRVMVRELCRQLDLRDEVTGTKHSRRLELISGTLHLTMVSAPGAKSGLAKRAMDLVEGTASGRPDIVGVVFDPDSDSNDEEREFFVRSFEKLEPSDQRGFTLTPTDDGFLAKRTGVEAVRLVLAPWRSANAAQFNGLPDENNLERVLIGGIVSSKIDESLAEWSTTSTTSLHAIAVDHGWKRAFKVWNAALQPKEESFVDKLLQARKTRDACRRAILETPAGDLVRRLLETEE